ncbi:NAD(P)/FAD-dependent oxidoreductase [Dyadobacter sp. CY356]|uniref:FAD-dependent oxidoreductase n=1 Tax=Dyadobacter sp. CY356 TaxID=2906442 RepID=UPI001F370ED1|nr:NAD(P)/FAD-dependent oxidoreductase [Dyadobacter sp. CY356]MCF0058807.1 FAD-dependent monooxygenase [Dyadobacter sp. CY356]
MILYNKKIAIIGGGPGGLTLARLLQLRGVDVKVYERDFSPEARVQGSPLDMHEESGWAALNKAGLTDEFKKHVRHGADKKIILNEQAEIVFSDHETKSFEGLNKEHYRPEIDRGALRKVFLNVLLPETVVWDSHFISLEKQNSGWLVYFKNGSVAYADLVIGADGAHSKIRPYVTDIKAVYTGITMLEINIENAATSIPDIFRLLNGGKVMAFGNGKCLLGGQKGDGGLGFYASFKTDENWALSGGLNFSDKSQMLDWFKNEYNQWSNIWYKLFGKASMPMIPRPIYCMPLDQNWQALPDLTLLGDAAHVMPPFAGEGANTSMFDAIELCECLTSGKHNTMLEAISSYEVSMRKRAARAAKQSLVNGERMHSEAALEKMLGVFGLK